jgi:hypothetical protein
MMSSPSEVVGWECGACAYINKDATSCNCLACQARCPVRYAVVAGTTAAAMARTMRVDHHDQARVAALPTAGPVVAGEGATSGNGEILEKQGMLHCSHARQLCGAFDLIV